MLFDELTLKDNYLNLHVKKTRYSNPVEINILPYQKKMQYACNNELKQVLRACLRHRLREANGTNY